MTTRFARMRQLRGRLSCARAGPKRVSAGMESRVSSHTELMNFYVINQHSERKSAEIFINISTASSDPAVISSTRSRRLLKSPSPSPSRKWWMNSPNLSLKWGFVKVFYNFCEHTRRLYFPNHNNWFYRPNFLICNFLITNFVIFNLYSSAFYYFFSFFSIFLIFPKNCYFHLFSYNFCSKA